MQQNLFMQCIRAGWRHVLLHWQKGTMLKLWPPRWCCIMCCADDSVARVTVLEAMRNHNTCSASVKRYVVGRALLYIGAHHVVLLRLSKVAAPQALLYLFCNVFIMCATVLHSTRELEATWCTLNTTCKNWNWARWYISIVVSRAQGVVMCSVGAHDTTCKHWP